MSIIQVCSSFVQVRAIYRLPHFNLCYLFSETKTLFFIINYNNYMYKINFLLFFSKTSIPIKKKTIEKATPVKHIFNGGILPCIIKVRNAVT